MGRFLVLLLLVAACSSEAVTPSPPDTTSSPDTASNPTAGSVTTIESASRWDIGKPFVGFSLSPAAFDEKGLNDFFEVASVNGSLIAWVGAWPEMAQGGDLVSGLSVRFDYVPVVVTGFPTDADQRRVVPDDPTEMIETVASWVGDNPVPYFGFGVEINSFLEEKAPEDFRWFVEVFPDVVAAVHQVSPETKVFPVFQLERLRGLRGGLFGGETVDHQWELIDLFPDADAIGFTTYPGLIFPRPGDMPADYYSEILGYTDKPIVFTEVGWQAGGDLGEWSGTEAKQAEFISEKVGELAGMAEMVIWSFLWDQNAAPPPFDTMGVIDDANQRRTGFEAWQQLFG